MKHLARLGELRLIGIGFVLCAVGELVPIFPAEFVLLVFAGVSVLCVLVVNPPGKRQGAETFLMGSLLLGAVTLAMHRHWPLEQCLAVWLILWVPMLASLGEPGRSRNHLIYSMSIVALFFGSWAIYAFGMSEDMSLPRWAIVPLLGVIPLGWLRAVDTKNVWERKWMLGVVLFSLTGGALCAPLFFLSSFCFLLGIWALCLERSRLVHRGLFAVCLSLALGIMLFANWSHWELVFSNLSVNALWEPTRESLWLNAPEKVFQFNYRPVFFFETAGPFFALALVVAGTLLFRSFLNRARADKVFRADLLAWSVVVWSLFWSVENQRAFSIFLLLWLSLLLASEFFPVIYLKVTRFQRGLYWAFCIVLLITGVYWVSLWQGRLLRKEFRELVMVRPLAAIDLWQEGALWEGAVPEDWYQLAVAFSAQKQHAKALECLNRGIDNQPRAEWMAARVEQQILLKHWQHAEVGLEQLEKKFPAWLTPLFLRASMKVSKGDVLGAQVVYQEVLERPVIYDFFRGLQEQRFAKEWLDKHLKKGPTDGSDISTTL